LTLSACKLIQDDDGMLKYDTIIIGAGHNGLVAAVLLAKAGKKVLVLERRPIVGGIAATEEVFAGFQFPTCAHWIGSMSQSVIANLELKKHGLEILPPDPSLFAPLANGDGLLIPRDPAKAAAELTRFSQKDAARYVSFSALVGKLSGFIPNLIDMPLPDGATADGFNLPDWIKLACSYRRLGKKVMREFLRVLPMSITDFLNEWFETEPLKAALGVTGLLGGFVGPRAQGTAYVFLHHLRESNGALRTAGQVRGGPGSLTRAIARAAERHGAEIRTEAEVARIVTRDWRATGVALANGDEIAATVVISNADVKRTFLQLVEPTYLDPRFLLQVRNIRSRGTVAKVNLALDRLPNFKRRAEYLSVSHCGGIIHIGPTLDYLERAADAAKYGRISENPFLEISIPSVADPSLAPQGKQVMSVWMQYAPYHLRGATWSERRDALGDLVIKLIDDHAPGFRDSILYRQVLTPLDMEQTFGLTEGHLYHAELALDQLFFMRPVPGWARYRTPIENFYLCGSGTHPGGGITGLPGYRAAKTILKSWPQNK
jgi:phytoene dehydrogenase-like protein